MSGIQMQELQAIGSFKVAGEIYFFRKLFFYFRKIWEYVLSIREAFSLGKVNKLEFT